MLHALVVLHSVTLLSCDCLGDTNNIGDVLERSNSINEDYVRYLSNPQNVEKRFPVDRKKLERLIVGVCVFLRCMHVNT